MASAGYFPSRPKGRFTSRSKIAGSAILRCATAAVASLGGAGPVRPPPFVATKGRDERGRPDKREATMTIERTETDCDQPYATSPTDHVLTELQLHGYRPFQDEPDPRPLPEARIVAAAVADIFDALIASLSETRLEPDLEDLLWSTVNLFHRANERIERELDDNDRRKSAAHATRTAPKIRSVELERLNAEGMTLIERRNSMEYFRDQAADPLRTSHRIALAPAQRLDGEPPRPDLGCHR